MMFPMISTLRRNSKMPSYKMPPTMTMIMMIIMMMIMVIMMMKVMMIMEMIAAIDNNKR